MKLLNIIYTNNQAESVAFYERLGLLRREDGEISQWWNEFPIGDATLALHWNQGNDLPTQSNPELNFQVETARFDELYAAIADLNPSEMATLQGMGRTFTVTDPNGVVVHINEVV